MLTRDIGVSAMKRTVDIAAAFEGKRILLTGATGFVGKVWLALMMAEVPTWRQIDVLIRAANPQAARERWDNIVATHKLFKMLRDRMGGGAFDEAISKVFAVHGDVSEPDFGLSAQDKQEFIEDTDLLVNSAGQVDFFPPLEQALDSNTYSALHVSDLINASERARLLHVSTCYVAGRREGVITEQSVRLHHPKMAESTVEETLDELKERLDLLRYVFDSPYGEEDRLNRERRRCKRDGREMPERGTEAWDRMNRRAWRDLSIAEGGRQADDRGHPNPYTMSKALGELAIEERVAPGRFSIFRPAIVESAQSFPCNGWNEGFNTSGPLIELIGTAFRHLPASDDHPFDVVPVDDVCRAMTLASAALLEGTHPAFVQCATSVRHPLTIGRACELTSLGHRRRNRRKGQLWMNELETIPVDPQGKLIPGYFAKKLRSLSEEIDVAIDRAEGSSADPTREGARYLKELRRGSSKILKGGRKLHRLQRLLDMYAPFLHETPQQYEAEALRKLEPTEASFKFKPEEICWRSYWLDKHMPGIELYCKRVTKLSVESVSGGGTNGS